MSIKKAIEAFHAPIPLGEKSASNLTKREYFAAMAMQGWLASFAPDAQISPEGKIQVAELAVQLSDALLAELEKTK